MWHVPLRRRSLGHGPPRLRLGLAGKGLVGQLQPRKAVQSDEVDVIAMAGARGTASGAQATRDLVACSRTPGVSTVEELLAEVEVEAVVLAKRTSEHAQQAFEVHRRGEHLRRP
jgi:predicted dehydrogenase